MKILPCWVANFKGGDSLPFFLDFREGCGLAKKTSQYGLIIQAKLNTQKTQVMSSLKADVTTIQGYLDADKTSKTKLLLTGKINISETKKQINEQLSTLKNLPTIKLASVIDTSGLTSQVRKALEAVGVQGTVQKYSPKERG